MAKVRVCTSRLPYYSERQDWMPDMARIIPMQAALLMADYDLESLASHLGRRRFRDITGAFVVVGDGDYSDIFVTWSSRPYLISTPYYRVTVNYS